MHGWNQLITYQRIYKSSAYSGEPSLASDKGKLKGIGWLGVCLKPSYWVI